MAASVPRITTVPPGSGVRAAGEVSLRSPAWRLPGPASDRAGGGALQAAVRAWPSADVDASAHPAVEPQLRRHEAAAPPRHLQPPAGDNDGPPARR